MRTPRVRPRMPDDSCNCSDSTHSGNAEDGRDAGPDTASDRLITETPVLHTVLPSDVQTTLGEFLGAESVGTLGEWVAEVRNRTGGGAITVDDLCHAAEETGHWGVTNGKTHHFECFYDAVILAALTETPVDVHTESADGTVIEAEAAGTTGLTVTPPEAVFSFGIAENVDPPTDGGPSHGDVYAAVCPYVRAFPTLDAYERWAETVPAATVAVPLAGATDVAAALVE